MPCVLIFAVMVACANVPHSAQSRGLSDNDSRDTIGAVR